MALLTECREWMRKAIGRIDDANSGTRQEMIIQSALASCMMFTGRHDRRVLRNLDKSAPSCRGPQGYRTSAGLSACSLGAPNSHPKTIPRRTDWPTAAAMSLSGAAIAAPSQWPITCAASPTTTQGASCRPKARLELSLHRDDEASRQSLIKRFGYDRKADALGVLANLVWLRGSPDQARRLNLNVDRRSTPTRSRRAPVRGADLGKLQHVSGKPGR